MKSISTSLIDTLKDSDLKDITKEWSEVFVDSFLAEEGFKEIPIIGTIIGLFKTGVRFNDTLFVKKLLYFISQINEIPAEERKKVISEIDDSKKFRIKIGEKLLYIIDKCDDHEKSEIIGYLFSKFLDQNIDYDTFLRCSLIIEKCMIDDLKWFVKSDTSSYQMRFDPELFNWGILEFAPLELKIQEKRNSNKGYEITDKDIKLKISSSGNIIRSCLRDYFKKQFSELKLTEMTLVELNNFISPYNQDLEKVDKRERINAFFVDVISEVCNNYVLTESEVKIFFTKVLNITGFYTLRYITREIELVYKEAVNNGNGFNLTRWTKFKKEFVDLHDLKDFKDDRL